MRLFVSSITFLICLGMTPNAFTKTCLDFGSPSKTGEIDRDEIAESSGLAVSRAYTDTFWTHNDSGDEARFFAISSGGDDLGTIRLTGANANDWEAMTIINKTT